MRGEPGGKNPRTIILIPFEKKKNAKILILLGQFHQLPEG